MPDSGKYQQPGDYKIDGEPRGERESDRQNPGNDHQHAYGNGPTREMFYFGCHGGSGHSYSSTEGI